MTARGSAGREAAIDADFEPASAETRARRRSRDEPGPRRSRGVTLPELLLGCCAAAIGGAVTAIAVGGAGSGAATGPLAVEMSGLKRTQAEQAERTEAAVADLVALRTRINAQAGRVDAGEAADAGLRAEIAALSAQISTLAGAGAAPQPGGTAATLTPLGSLMARIDRVEAELAADAAQPQTLGQMQHALADLSARVAALDGANAVLSETLEQRTAAAARLEAELAEARARIDALGAGAVRPAAMPSPSGAPSPDAGGARMEALALLEAAAERGLPFPGQQRRLAALSPGDASVAALSDIARTGAPTLEQLRRQFDPLARPVEAKAAELADDGWNWLRTSVSGVAIEPTVERDAAAAIRQALARGDLAGAARAALPARFREWRGAALRRIDLDARLARLKAPG
jgi:hypothetical protein